MRELTRVLALLLLVAGTVCAQQTPPERIVVQFGNDLAPRLRVRIEALLRSAAGRAQAVEVRRPWQALDGLPARTLILGFGETRATRTLISRGERTALGSEGFIVRTGLVSGTRTIAADGNPPSPDPLRIGRNLGLSFGSYRLLEELGFAFLHPLAPTIPVRVFLGPLAVNLRERPYWPVRGWHLHTMHPTELTDVLNGWGRTGPDDEAGWRAMLPEWETFLEWLVAQRQNRVQWVLLSADPWRAFADSPTRQARLAELVRRAHRWGIGAGADVPIALQQQHAWRLVQRTGDLADELAQIRARIDWLMACGFDFVATEAGFSEFTAPDDRRMLAWMDEVARYVRGTLGKPAYIKIHTSTGQVAENFLDPETGQPINFNFLPHYADPRLGVMPHTVQHYGLEDPAPTYGNTDFSEIRRFQQMQAGRREVLWHPETAYWVSFDADVPLFLPVYADRRRADLRRIAEDERAGRTGRGDLAGSRIDGQVVFSSGWEWGYWLQEVVAARGAWNPFPGLADDRNALRRSLDPVVRPFGGVADRVRDLLVRVMRDQRALLIEGRVAGRLPRTAVKRNGQAYMQGWETWDDVSGYLVLFGIARGAMTQPDRLGMVRAPLPDDPDYWTEVEPLLAEMQRVFTSHADEFDSLRPLIPLRARPLFNDLADAARITALRAAQVNGLYGYVARRGTAEGLARLANARAALDQAAVVVARREAAYRVDPQRIASWRTGPTAYSYGYLWTARTLYYWWRDEGKAVLGPWSPFYLNIVNPVDVALGEGIWVDLARTVRRIAEERPGWWTLLLQGVAEPPTEPVLPPSGLRN